jgi:ubiquinone biosynthesis monooxygenase Coq7
MPPMATPATLPDRLIAVLDEALRTMSNTACVSRRSPADDIEEPSLSVAEKRRSAALMRVNHAGEVSAQALYVGQALTARSERVRERLLESAREERDHLVWCAERIDELEGRKSVLGPLWFAGSFAIGIAAGACSDRLSLGFVTETERQVEAHIDDHLRRLPAADAKSAAILRKMGEDEAHHGRAARLAGGAELPSAVRRIMGIGGGILRRGALIL